MVKRNIYNIPSVMRKIAVLEDSDEDRYSEIPRWDGMIERWTEFAILIGNDWFPISQLRKTGDDSEIYASFWILEQKGY